MKRYKLIKVNKKYKLENKISLKGGCSVNAKNNIIIYDDQLKGFVINKKLTNILNQIVLLYKLYSVDSSDENAEALTIRIDYFRRLLFNNYRLHIPDKDFKKYNKQVSSIEKQINQKKVRRRQI